MKFTSFKFVANPEKCKHNALIFTHTDPFSCGQFTHLLLTYLHIFISSSY